jgi:BirA family biotin operon repressor/biotin-[acetyl-CoA-carboxylase] ligase
MTISSAAFHPLTVDAVQRVLSTRTFGRVLHLLDETTSTNAVAFNLAQAGAPHGAVVLAEAQSAGRGRHGRQWYSPPGSNLYCSILLRPSVPGEFRTLWFSWMPLLSALAAARAVQVVAGLRPALKWPNDILLGSRKVGGVLCESSGLGTPPLVIVVGIGLNVNISPEAFPENLRLQATSIAYEAGQPFDRSAILGALLSELEVRYETLASGRFADLQQEYLLRCSTTGAQVRVSFASGETLEGRADSIGPDGALRIIPHPSEAHPTGSIIEVRTGDVLHVRPTDVTR